ncbi:MAG TPA: GNAT family N-acetyltransferase [Solirubrobacterales bacterium]|nr:GNAT family N-acetyltransferase [Solirubrobacterales bacterium]
MTEDARIVVTDAPGRQRFEVSVDGEPAGFLVYRSRKGLLALIHTEVEERFEGRGLGGRLARFALDQARERGLAVLPFCPFVNEWMKRHTEYVDLVPPAYRAEFDL